MLGHLEGAVATHVYQEESDWFVEMKQNAPAEAQARATARYAEEYGRYIDAARTPATGPLNRAHSHQRPIRIRGPGGPAPERPAWR